MEVVHQMVFHRVAEAGAEEWLCSACSRRVLLWWPPHYQRLVLEPGDATATHAGGKTGSAAVPDPVGVGDREWLRSEGIDWDGPVS